jgi:hypothetical protein
VIKWDKVFAQQDSNERYNELKECMMQAAAVVIPKTIDNNLKATVRFFDDRDLRELSKKQKHYNKLIYHSSKRKRTSIHMKRYKSDRNKCTREINKRIQWLITDKLENIIQELEKTKDTVRVYEVTKLLQPPQRSPLQILDNNGILCTNPQKIATNITEFYKDFFNPSTHEEVKFNWNECKELEEPITTEEVQAAVKKLRNGRACGKDQIHGELIKYAGIMTHQSIAAIINGIFLNKSEFTAIGEGLLMPLNKPGKPKTVDNTRAITLLNTIRKLLSIIILQRIYPNVDTYLSPNQSGFRRNRSTGDVVWAYRCMDSIAKKYDKQFSIMGIDMSKAFDCINRNKLINEVIEKIIPSNSNKQILKYLLSNTTLQPIIDGHLGETFQTIQGTPQGDSLSPVLFTIYLEGAMRYLKQRINYDPNNLETCYADDVDFINDKEELNRLLEPLIKEHFTPWGLKVNDNKTEFINITRTSTPQTRKLGSRIDPVTDITIRITSGNFAFKSLNKIWRNYKHIRLSTKIKMYNTYILPIMMYNMGSCATTELNMNKIDVAHRKHLRRIMGVHYPNKISNEKLYKNTSTEPLTNKIYEMRWKLFGHILRQEDERIPPKKIMKQYMLYQDQGTKISKGGHRKRTLMSSINDQIKLIGKTFKSTQDLIEITHIAKDRKKWKKLREKVIERIIRGKKRAEHQQNLRKEIRRKIKKCVITIPPKSNIILIIRKRKREETKSDTEDNEEDEINETKPLFEIREKKKQKIILIMTETDQMEIDDDIY